MNVLTIKKMFICEITIYIYMKWDVRNVGGRQRFRPFSVQKRVVKFDCIHVPKRC